MILPHPSRRRVLSGGIVAILTGCAAPKRIAFTAQDQIDASVPGFEGLRAYADMPAADLPAWNRDFLPNAARPVYLALSSGGAGGAFGAGLLSGWTLRGDRPAFDLVTGVSAGALIAPFAFVGSDADAALVTLFDTGIAAKLDDPKPLFSGILGTSLFDAKPLRDLIGQYVTTDLLTRIAERQRRGARLLVLTTNIDAERSVIWNMGAIAASAHPGAAQLFGDVLAASASIPAVFPAMPITVTGRGRSFQELHSDGGVIRQIFLTPDATFVSGAPTAAFDGARPVIYAIVNHELDPAFEMVTDRSIAVAKRAYEALIKSSIRSSIAAFDDLALRGGFSFNLAFIDRHVPMDPRNPFDPVYMKTVFALGRQKGASGAWTLRLP